MSEQCHRPFVQLTAVKLGSMTALSPDRELGESLLRQYLKLPWHIRDAREGILEASELEGEDVDVPHWLTVLADIEQSLPKESP